MKAGLTVVRGEQIVLRNESLQVGHTLLSTLQLRLERAVTRAQLGDALGEEMTRLLGFAHLLLGILGLRLHMRQDGRNLVLHAQHPIRERFADALGL